MSQQIQKESGLVKFIRFGLYLTALVPLIVFRDYISPFHFWKVLIFRNLVEILTAAYLILILREPVYRLRPNKVWWGFFLFTSAFTLTTLTSVLRYPSFWGFLERMGGLWTFWHYFLFLTILVSTFTKPEHWRKLLDLTIFAGVLSAFYGFFQKTNIEFFLGSGGRERIFGTIGNAALFAGYELISVFLSLMFYFDPKNSSKRKVWYLIAFGLMSVAVFMTAVRGSLLGFGIGLAVFAFLFMKHRNPRLGRRALAVVVGLALFWGIFSWLFADLPWVKNSRYLSRVTNVSLTAVTVKTRVWAWQAGLKGWRENPKTMLLGWGPENFNIPFSKYFNPKFYAGQGSETLYDRAHNMFIEVLVTMGLVGLLGYLAVFAGLFGHLKKLLKDHSLYATGLISLLITYIIHNSFIFDTNPNFIVFFTVAGFVAFLGRPSAVRQLADEPPRVERLSLNDKRDSVPKGQRNVGMGTINILAAIFIVLIPVLIYKTTILPARANFTTTRAIVSGWGGDALGAIEKYQEATAYKTFGKYEYRHRFAQYLVGPGAPSVREEKVKEAHLRALEGIDKNIKENPIDYLPYLYGSRVSIMLGKDDHKSIYNDRALEYSMKALELSPTFIRTFYEIAQAYLNKNEFEKAIEYFQKAVDLNPDTGVSWWYMGSAKVQKGDLSGIDDMEKALTTANKFNAEEPDYLKLINYHVKINNFARIVTIYERMIGKNPNNPQHYASLATAYVKLGRIEEAIKMTRKAVEIDPSFATDAKIFLKSLGREL